MDFVLHSESQNGNSKKVWKPKRKEKKCKEFKSTWRVFVLHSEFQKGIQRRFERQKEKKRNEENLNPPEGFCITFRIPEGNSKKIWKPKRKERKWEEFKSTRKILYYI